MFRSPLRSCIRRTILRHHSILNSLSEGLYRPSSGPAPGPALRWRQNGRCAVICFYARDTSVDTALSWVYFPRPGWLK